MAHLATASDLSTIYEVNETYASMISARLPPDSFLVNMIEISISDTKIYDENAFAKYVIYRITGKDSSGCFEANRRYKDFLTLRDQMSYRWPGCFIPSVPPKRILGNLTYDFIESRRSLLERFLLRISKINYLYTSEEFQLFIRGTADFEGIIRNLKVTPRDISIIYQSLFCDFNDKKVTDEMLHKLLEYDSFFKNSLNSILNFKKNVKMIENQFEHFKSQFMLVNTKIKEVEAEYIIKMQENGQRNKIQRGSLYIPNPFNQLYN